MFGTFTLVLSVVYMCAVPNMVVFLEFLNFVLIIIIIIIIVVNFW